MSKISNQVYSVEEITLSNDHKDIDLTLRPLPVARLRKFMAEWEKMAELYDGVKNPNDVDQDKIFDVYVRCCGVALSKQLATEVDGAVFKDNRVDFTDEYLELLEDFLDLQSIYKIMDVCGGIKLEVDPNLLATLAED